MWPSLETVKAPWAAAFAAAREALDATTWAFRADELALRRRLLNYEQLCVQRLLQGVL